MKILGSILILASSVLASYYYEKSYKSKIITCEEIIDFISFIRTQIDYFSYPVDVIYQKYDKKTETIEYLTQNKDGKKMLIDTSTDKKISEFFSSIGMGFKKEQLCLCEYNLELLNKKLEALKREYPNKIKVFRSMSLFIGICTVILFI